MAESHRGKTKKGRGCEGESIRGRERLREKTEEREEIYEGNNKVKKEDDRRKGLQMLRKSLDTRQDYSFNLHNSLALFL